MTRRRSVVMFVAKCVLWLRKTRPVQWTLAVHIRIMNLFTSLVHSHVHVNTLIRLQQLQESTFNRQGLTWRREMTKHSPLIPLDRVRVRLSSPSTLIWDGEKRKKRKRERGREWSEYRKKQKRQCVEKKRRWERKETISGNFSVLSLYSTTHPQVIVLPLLQKSCYNNPHSECSHWNTPKVTLTQRDNHIFNSRKPALPHPSSPIVFSQHHPTVLLTSSKERQK